MKNSSSFFVSKTVSTLVCTFFSIVLFAQEQAVTPKAKSDFWQKVQFGGGIGLSIGSGFTDITLAPGAIYHVNPYFSAGAGLQFSYVSSKNNFTSAIYGGSLIALINPIEEVQFSVEVEQVRVNNEVELLGAGSIKDNFWNTGLYLGAGYRTNNVTIGARYNVLFDRDKSVYSDAFMPFVRAYF